MARRRSGPNIVNICRLAGFPAHGKRDSAYFSWCGKSVRVSNHTRRASQAASDMASNPDITVIIVLTNQTTIADDAVKPDWILVREKWEIEESIALRLMDALSDLIEREINV